jgi:uncharacterized membrane protein
MAKSAHPGIVIAIFLNLVLLLGIPFFGKGEAAQLGPLILLALAMPWLLAWGVGRVIKGIREDALRKREEDDHTDFV